MASALLENRNQDFLAEVRKVQKTTATVTSQVDSACGPEEISQLFASKYNDIYNSVSYDMSKMSKLMTDIEENVDRECTYVFNIFYINIL